MSRRHLRYPKALYPQKDYNLIKPDQWFIDNMSVLRFTEDGIPILDEQSLKSSIAKHFNKDRWYNGISVALCGPFRKSDVRFVFHPKKKNSFSKPWKVGRKVRYIKPRFVTIKPNRGFFGIQVKDLMGVQFNYKFEYKDADIKKERTDQCKLILQHDPTRSNFWHFEIWIESFNKEKNIFFINEVGMDKLPSKRNLSKRAEASFLLLRNIVRMPEQILEVELPSSYYIR